MGRPPSRSRTNPEVHVRNCEGVGVKLPRAIRLNSFYFSVAYKKGRAMADPAWFVLGVNYG